MTTIIADFHLRTMVADSSLSDGDRTWVGRKVRRIGREVIGFAGSEAHFPLFLEWYRAGCASKPPATSDSQFLILNDGGLYLYDTNYKNPHLVESGREAIGTGAKAAMCTYEALGFRDPKRAVRIVCKHDSASRTPVRVYTLKEVHEQPAV